MPDQPIPVRREYQGVHNECHVWHIYNDDTGHFIGRDVTAVTDYTGPDPD